MQNESIRITNRMESIRIANWNALAVISVVVAVAVRRLQRRRVSAHEMTNGTQELESRIRPVVELGQTGLDSRLVYDVRFAFRAAHV